MLQSAAFAAPEATPKQGATPPSGQSANESAASAPSEKTAQDATSAASIASAISNVITGTLSPSMPNIPVPNVPASSDDNVAPPAQNPIEKNPPTANRVLDLPGEKPVDASSLSDIAARLNLSLPLPKARIVVLKSQRRLELWNAGQLVKAYQVALGGNPVGAKTRQHDNRTPEGRFTICTRNATTSAFHIFLGLSYPSLPDATRGVNRGTITWREYALIQRQLASRSAPPWETRLGGWVGIHGGTGGTFAQKQSLKRGRSDWTAGCVALTNSEIEELYAATKMGTPVWIRP